MYCKGESFNPFTVATLIVSLQLDNVGLMYQGRGVESRKEREEL